MKVLKWFLIIFAAIAVALLAYLWYLGAFSPVKVVEREMGPYTIAYKSFVGEYKETGKVFMDVYGILKEAGFAVTEKSDSLGIYYDDPAKVAKDKLRSDCGFVISKEDSLKAIALLKKDIKVMTVPQSKCLVIEFPMKNMLSFIVGVMKAYPALNEYAAKNNIKTGLVYEYYDMKNNKILFTMQIGK
ncbi:MAG: GyrI-like domain-containing protein [Candidatus Margulisiibacteriota bacterium]